MQKYRPSAFNFIIKYQITEHFLETYPNVWKEIELFLLYSTDTELTSSLRQMFRFRKNNISSFWLDVKETGDSKEIVLFVRLSRRYHCLSPDAFNFIWRTTDLKNPSKPFVFKPHILKAPSIPNPPENSRISNNWNDFDALVLPAPQGPEEPTVEGFGCHKIEEIVNVARTEGLPDAMSLARKLMPNEYFKDPDIVRNRIEKAVNELDRESGIGKIPIRSNIDLHEFCWDELPELDIVFEDQSPANMFSFFFLGPTRCGKTELSYACCQRLGFYKDQVVVGNSSEAWRHYRKGETLAFVGNDYTFRKTNYPLDPEFALAQACCKEIRGIDVKYSHITVLPGVFRFFSGNRGDELYFLKQNMPAFKERCIVLDFYNGRNILKPGAQGRSYLRRVAEEVFQKLDSANEHLLDNQAGVREFFGKTAFDEALARYTRTHIWKTHVRPLFIDQFGSDKNILLHGLESEYNKRFKTKL